MSANLNAYLNFRGNAREAMEFYRSVFGGGLDLSSFGDFGMSQDPAEKDKIMHGQLMTDSGWLLMGADVPSGMDHDPGSNHFSLSLSGGPEDEAELRGYWDKLVEGGTVGEQLTAAPWGDLFGMCTDRFGIHWMVNIGSGEQPPA